MLINNLIIDRIIAEKGREKRALIPILQAIQKEFNYLPEEALRYVCDITDIIPADIIGVASFYSQFRLQPFGRHTVKVCVGTACHVKGSDQVYDAFRRKFKLGDGENTDLQRIYTLEKVSCLGCCTLAPVVQIDQVTYGHVTTSQVDEVITDFESPGVKKEKTIQEPRRKGNPGRNPYRTGLMLCCQRER